MSYSFLLKSIATRLSPIVGEFALPEAERILGYLLDCSRSGLYIDKGEQPPSPGLAQRIETIISRRLTGEPLAYILGSAFFYNKEFAVTPDVLIPRPDTEILVDVVLKQETGDDCRFLDIGTGSGCIAASLTEQRASWRAVAIDLSLRALAVARKNCGTGVRLVCADCASAIRELPAFDFVVSNPPYIKTGELPFLQSSVRVFEPVRALDGGRDGLDFYRVLAKTTPPLLCSGGRIYCEIGYDQGTSVPAVFRSGNWKDIEVTKDFGGRSRVIRATKPG